MNLNHTSGINYALNQISCTYNKKEYEEKLNKDNIMQDAGIAQLVQWLSHKSGDLWFQSW